MPLYEHVFLARPELSRRQVEQLADELTSVIAQGGGQCVKSEYWGLRQTAYPVKKQHKAHYTMLCFSTPSSAMQEMERRMRFNTDVLRFLSLRVDKIDAEPSPMTQNKMRDDTRRRRDTSADADALSEGQS